MLKRELLELIIEWIYYNDRQREINKYLFEHTELYEMKYMTDYRENLFNFFAGKINRYARDYNTLMNTLNNEEIEEIKKIKMLKR